MIGKAVVDLVASARLRVLREGVAPDAIEFEVNAKMKYKLQVHAIDVAIEFEETPDAAALRERFHTRYSELYGAGAGYRSAGVEIVGFRCTAIGRRHARGMHLSLIRSSPPHVGASAREVYWIHERASIQTAVLCEADLRPGWTGGGPAVIELPDTTVLVPPDFIAALDDRGNIHLNRAETAA